MSVSLPFLGYLSGLARLDKAPRTRKPTHGTYLLVPRPATAILPGLHLADLPDLRLDRLGLGPLSATPVHYRSYLLQRQCRQRALVAVPSLLQPCRLGHRHLLPLPGQVGHDDPRPGQHRLLGGRRHALSQARLDPLWGRHALRPAHLQSLEEVGQLGARLGRPLPHRRPSLLGTHQGLCLADRRPALHQPPGTHQGKERQREIDQGPGGAQSQDQGSAAPKPRPRPKRPDHRTRPELALELILLAARWFPDDEILMLGDSAYGGRSVLLHLPPNVHFISRVHPKAALYKPAPPKIKGTQGRPRKKGDRLPSMAEWAADAEQPWTQLDFNQFGLHAALEVKTTRGPLLQIGPRSPPDHRPGA